MQPQWCMGRTVLPLGGEQARMVLVKDKELSAGGEQRQRSEIETAGALNSWWGG